MWMSFTKFHIDMDILMYINFGILPSEKIFDHFSICCQYLVYVHYYRVVEQPVSPGIKIGTNQHQVLF